MKRFLKVFGAISMMGLLSLVAGLGFIGSQAISAAEQNKKTAVEAIREISQSWSVIAHPTLAVLLVNAKSPALRNQDSAR